MDADHARVDSAVSSGREGAGIDRAECQGVACPLVEVRRLGVVSGGQSWGIVEMCDPLHGPGR